MNTQTFMKTLASDVLDIVVAVNEHRETQKKLVELVKDLPIMQQATVQRAMTKGWTIQKIQDDVVFMHNYTTTKGYKSLSMKINADGSYTR